MVRPPFCRRLRAAPELRTSLFRFGRRSCYKPQMAPTPAPANRVQDAVSDPAPFADFHTLTAELRAIRDDIAHLRAELDELRRMVENSAYRPGVPDVKVAFPAIDAR